MADPIAPYDLTVVRGDTFERQTFVMEDADGVHVPFTGYTVLAQVRVAANAPGLLLEFTSGIDENGDPYIEATADETAGTGAISKAVWDLEMTSPTNQKRTYIGGDVTIVQDVSH